MRQEVLLRSNNEVKVVAKTKLVISDLEGRTVTGDMS